MTDWRDQLREFLDKEATEDRSWSNRYQPISNMIHYSGSGAGTPFMWYAPSAVPSLQDIEHYKEFLRELGFEDIHYDP